MKFVAVKKWKLGGESVIEYFNTQAEALAWISKQRKPKVDEYYWCVGEFE